MNHPKIARWLGRSTWSFLDQGLFAISNFVLNVLLARWLGESDYGSFSVAFTVFLFLGVAYSAVMVEPMLVFGPGRFDGAFHGYLKVLSRLHWMRLSLLTCGAGVGFSLFYIGTEVFPSLLALALCSGVIFYQWLLRRACYVRMEPQTAAIGGMIYLIVMLGGAFGLRHFELLGAVSGILLMAIASAAAAYWIVLRLHRAGSDSREAPAFNEAQREHWIYGRWALVTGLLGWVPGNIYMLLLPHWHGEESAGEFRAAFNIGLPMFQILATAAVIMLPMFVRMKGRPDYLNRVLILGALLVVPSIFYVLLCWAFGPLLFKLLYDGAFSGVADVLWLIILPMVPASAVAVLSAAMRALEAPRQVFVAYIGSTAVCLGIGIPLAYQYSVVGVAIGIALSSAVCGLILAIQLWRVLRLRESTQTPAAACESH